MNAETKALWISTWLENGKPFIEGNLRDSMMREKAAELAAEGLPIGVFNRSVCAIWGDAGNADFVNAIYRIKGEARRGKTFATTYPSSEFVKFIDPELVSPQIAELLKDSDLLANRFGSLCFLRAPVSEEALNFLPPHVVSENGGLSYVQNWDPYGHQPVCDLVGSMIKKGVKIPSVTSMNVSGQPPKVKQDEGSDFSRDKGIPIFLRDSKDRQVSSGSYSIVVLKKEGVEIARSGNVTDAMLSKLFDIPFEKEVKDVSSRQIIPESLINELSPEGLRKALIYALQGADEEKLNELKVRKKL